MTQSLLSLWCGDTYGLQAVSTPSVPSEENSSSSTYTLIWFCMNVLQLPQYMHLTPCIWWFTHPQMQTPHVWHFMPSNIGICQAHDTVKQPQFSPYSCYLSITKTCQGSPAPNINWPPFLGTVWVTWLMMQRCSNWVKISLLSCCISMSLSYKFSLSVWPEAGKGQKMQHILQKTPVWQNNWLFCDLSIVVWMPRTCGGGFCIEKHLSVRFTLFGNHLPYLAIVPGWLWCQQENHRDTGEDSDMCKWV